MKEVWVILQLIGRAVFALADSWFIGLYNMTESLDKRFEHA